MAKKKDKPQVINNIQELNLEIDYDKLAEAIVKAQEKSEEEKKPKDNLKILEEKKDLKESKKAERITTRPKRKEKEQ